MAAALPKGSFDPYLLDSSDWLKGGRRSGTQPRSGARTMTFK